MLFDLTGPHQLSMNEVGGKAFNLHRLAHIGLPVPAGIVVSASAYAGLDKDLLRQLHSQILSNETIIAGDLFAVRSSGVGEDGQENSCAGIFESYTDVPKAEIQNAIIQVWGSLNNARSAMYARERNIHISSMGVVVQHMVDAEYAGVAFTKCPIENDTRIVLLEIVQGGADSLVSGKKTPATLRINKMTGMIRISRKGADEIPDYTLAVIVETLMPLIEKIEAEYRMPMDIEWAIANEKPHILQARPITT